MLGAVAILKEDIFGENFMNHYFSSPKLLINDIHFYSLPMKSSPNPLLTDRSNLSKAIVALPRKTIDSLAPASDPYQTTR